MPPPFCNSQTVFLTITILCRQLLKSGESPAEKQGRPCLNLNRLFLATIPKIAHIRILVKGFGVGAFLFLNPCYDCCKYKFRSCE
jgi:hypothetical protein